MKKIIKEIIPPAILKLLVKNLAPKAISSFDQAVISVKNNAYEQEELVNLVLKKNEIYRLLPSSSHLLTEDSTRILMAIGLARDENKINVIDFGGGGGNHFTIAKIGFDNKLLINWNIVETNLFVEKARLIEVKNLKYFYDLEEASKEVNKIDLLLTSSALQYCPDPIEMLDRLTKTCAKYLYITRTPLSSGSQTIYSTQSSWLSKNGPGPLPEGFQDRQISYPICYASRHQVERVLNMRYDIVFKTDEGEAPAFRVKGAKISMTGYFCKLR